MASLTNGCVLTNELFPTQLWAAGSRVVGPVALPDKYGYGWVLIDVSQLTNLTAAITTTVELSFDSGTNWQSVGGWGLDLPSSGYQLVGGQVLDAAGEPVRITGQALRLPQRAMTTRQIRMTVALSQPAAVGLTVALW